MRADCGNSGRHSGIREIQKLALAVIDEQHRFGVRQRAAFGSVEDDGSDANAEDRVTRLHQPHILVMTATPIPAVCA
ncbi:MAG: hypothetical protein R3C49_16790 [Planctomycetaceae bacterium]